MIERFLDRPGHNQHDLFQAWRRRNPTGRFLAFRTQNKALLHLGVGCHHPGTPDWSFTPGGPSLTTKLKVCSNEEAELIRWATKNRIEWTWCAHCETAGSRDSAPTRAGPSPSVHCYLLGWNPKRWDWTTLDEDLLQISLGKVVQQRWSTGNSRRISKGDRLLLLKQGVPPTGLMASGTAASGVFEAPHWDAIRAANGAKSLCVKVRFDRIVSPESVLPVERLENAVPEVNWHPQAGGVQVPAAVVPTLEALWHSHVPSRTAQALADEVTPGVHYMEGAVQAVLVNRYERDPRARVACLNAHGMRCVVCDFSFEDRYGELGAGFIHVHHLVPLSTHGEPRALDPIKDLRPVCANCHAMLHRGCERPRTIEELRATLIRQV